MIIPSIDLMDGKAVQLKQGQDKVLEREDVFALLEEFSLYGEVAIIDLIAERDHGTPRPRMQSVCSVGKRVISCVMRCVGSLG